MPEQQDKPMLELLFQRMTGRWEQWGRTRNVTISFSFNRRGQCKL